MIQYYVVVVLLLRMLLLLLLLLLLMLHLVANLTGVVLVVVIIVIIRVISAADPRQNFLWLLHLSFLLILLSVSVCLDGYYSTQGSIKITRFFIINKH